MSNEVLKEKLKEKGLDIAEDQVKLAVEQAFDLLEVIVDLTENKTDDLLKGIIPVVKPSVMTLVDKIDGKEG